MFETTTENSIPEIPDGEYTATFTHMNGETSKYGTIVRWYFDIDVNGETVTLDAISNARFTPNTKGWVWFENILGKKLKVGQKISDTMIVNNKCTVVIQHKKVTLKNGEQVDYPKIVDIKPVTVKGK